MKKFFLLALLLTFTFPAYAATPKRVVYTIERPTTLNNAPATHYQLWSVRVDGKDDRLLDKATQPERTRSIVEFPIDNRILVTQEQKDGTERHAILTPKGKDVTSEYPKKYFENNSQNHLALRSPNRKWVAFTKYSDVIAFPEINPFHVYLRDQKTKKLRDFYHASFEVGIHGIYPLAWSPDSRYLYVQSGSYEGIAVIKLWRIDTVKGTIYQYKNPKGIETIGFVVNKEGTFALGTSSRSEGMSTSPPSEIVRIDLKNDHVKVLHRSTKNVFLTPSFGPNSDTIIFNEVEYEANSGGWNKATIQQLNIRTGKLTQIGRVGAQIASTANGRWLVYEQRSFDKDGSTLESTFYLRDLVKGIERLIAKDNMLVRMPTGPDPYAASASALCEKQRVRIVGIFSE